MSTITDQIRGLEKPFGKINGYGLDFRAEALFAKQQLLKNDYTLKAAQNSPQALANAILNVAAIGISLNPATKHAYLVPRSPKKGAPAEVCLDISYLGLVKLATDSGAVSWVKADLVYEGDDFVWRGMTELPKHEFDPFDSERMNAAQPLKNLRGGYCVAKLADGTFMVDRMTAAEILEIKNASKASNGPWSGPWAGEMAKKSLVKRASKSWPQSADRHRIDKAVHVLNEHEGIETHDPVDEEKLNEFVRLVATGTPMDVLEFMSDADEQLEIACYNTAPQGEKTKFKDRVKGMISEANAVITAYVDEIASLAETSDPAAIQYYDELDEQRSRLVNARLTQITQTQLEELRKAAA